jgi:protein-tyrosine phosphatase
MSSADLKIASWSRRKDEYGRTLGWANHVAFSCLLSLGALRYFARVDWSDAQRLVFVCNGNICRSPYAEARANAEGLRATSFGLRAASGSPANAMALSIATEHGVDLRTHRARAAGDVIVSPHDVIIAMEPWQGWRLRRHTKLPHVQLTLLGLWAQTPRPYLQDPYGLSAAYFRTCFTQIDNAVTRLSVHMGGSKSGSGNR